MKRRFPKLPRWLGGIYLFWSLLVFFGSLGSESHSWWPIFLYWVIWPLSTLYEALSSLALDRLISDTLNDYIAGTFYIVAGTIWIWCLGRLFSMLVTRVFPIRGEPTERFHDASRFRSLFR